MIVTHKLTMDLARPCSPVRLDAVQGDAGSRAVEIALYSGSQPWAVPQGITAALRYRKSDGTRGSYDTLPDGSPAWSAEDNRLTLFLAPQVLTAEGVVFAQGEMVLGEKILATFPFRIHVAADPAAGAVDSEDYVNWTRWIQGELDRYLREVREDGGFTGPQGATFTPAVSGSGILSWTNDRGLPNPAAVDIRGPGGKSAYEYAVEGGYPGSEADFAAQLGADFAGGGGTASGDLDMGGNRITGLAGPAAEDDAATRGYVDAKRKTLALTLAASGWNGGSQQIAAAGVTAESTVLIAPAPEFLEAWTGKRVRCLGQSQGTLDFGCGSVPEGDLTVYAVILN